MGNNFITACIMVFWLFDALRTAMQPQAQTKTLERPSPEAIAIATRLLAAKKG
jgi:hypothetical protein